MKNIYPNPVCAGADPFVLRVGNTYYHYATNDPNGYHVLVSTDLIHWEDRGYCLHKDDVQGEKWFWAPEILALDGRYYMVYTADEHLGLAIADDPTGPFRQTKKGWLSERHAIDGHLEIGADGCVYLYYVRFDGGNVIYGTKLAETADAFVALAEAGEVQIGDEVRLLAAEETWETHMGKVAEGPFILQHGGKYYLTYSANDYQSPLYAIGYAVSDTPLGTYRKYAGNPILVGHGAIVGTGHHSFTTTKDGKEFVCVYHCHNSVSEIHPRMTCIAPAAFVTNDDGEDVLRIYGE